MKNHILSFMLCVMTSLLPLTSCGDKKPSQEPPRMPETATEPTAAGVQKMQESLVEDTVRWRGHLYIYRIHRLADTSLPMVEDEQGTAFADNRITLDITDENGGKFYSNVLTKTGFNKFLDDAFRQRSVMEGVVFDRITPAGLQFAASVCYPNSDVFIPLLITIRVDGSVHVQKDNTMDTEPFSVDDEGV